MINWMEILKRMNHEEIYFWLGQREEENDELTRLMDENIFISY
ncbi:hypothetical protein ACRE7Q_24030 [Klebsiella pneumoniae]